MVDLDRKLAVDLLKRLRRPNCCETIAVYGDGPHKEDAFADLLESLGMTPDTFMQSSEVVVIGQERWDAENLNRILVKRRGKQLRVYSQDMFLDYLASGEDPLDLDEQQIRARYALGHPALEFLSQKWPTWPSTQVDGRLSRT